MNFFLFLFRFDSGRNTRSIAVSIRMLNAFLFSVIQSCVRPNNIYFMLILRRERQELYIFSFSYTPLSIRFFPSLDFFLSLLLFYRNDDFLLDFIKMSHYVYHKR